MKPEKASGLSPELQAVLEPLLAGIESLSEQIREYNEQIEHLAQESYPQVALLKQVKGVGTLIALTYLLTLEDAHRFRKSRDVGCYLGLQPGRRKSGQSEPQLKSIHQVLVSPKRNRNRPDMTALAVFGFRPDPAPPAQ